MPGRIDTVKSGAVIFFRSSSTITSLAICRRLAAQSCRRSSRSCISAMRPLSPVARASSVECRADDRRDDLVQIGQALDCVGEGLLVDLGIVSPDAVPNDLIAHGGKGDIYCKTLVLVRLS